MLTAHVKLLVQHGLAHPIHREVTDADLIHTSAMRLVLQALLTAQQRQTTHHLCDNVSAAASNSTTITATTTTIIILVLGRIASCSTSNSAYSQFVCRLSHLCTQLKQFHVFRCHLAATLDAHGVQGKGRFGVKPCSQNMLLQIAAATWQIQSSDSDFFQITFVLVWLNQRTFLELLQVRPDPKKVNV